MSFEDAEHNLAILATYDKNNYARLAKFCRADLTNIKGEITEKKIESETRKAMIKWLMDNGFAAEKKPGHKTGKKGDAMQPGTSKYIKQVGQALTRSGAS